MRKQILVTSALAAMLLGSTAFAATPPSAAAAESAAVRSDMPRHHQRKGHDNKGHDNMWQQATAEERAVLMTLRQLERAYMRQDRGDEMQAVYNDVLARSKSALITRYAEQGLQRVQQKRLTPQERIDQLKQELDTRLGEIS